MIKEDFFYDNMTKTITDRIISLIKSGEKHFEDYIPWEYDIPILEGSRFISWSYRIARVPDIPRIDMWASAGANENFEPSLDIAIVLRKGQHQKKAKIDYPELYGVIAHELHHIAQNTEETGHLFPVWETGSDQLDYFVDPIEVEAFNLGFRAQSFLSGEPVEKIMKNYLDMQNLTSDQVDFAMSLWLHTDYPVIRKNLEKE